MIAFLTSSKPLPLQIDDVHPPGNIPRSTRFHPFLVPRTKAAVEPALLPWAKTWSSGRTGFRRPTPRTRRSSRTPNAAYGLAWREELAYDRRVPRSIDLAAWLASSTDGYPAARPYCPDLYVGKWSQLEPDSSPLATWELHLDGTLVTTDSRFQKRERWCVHRQGAGPVGDALWLDDALEISHKILLVRAVSPSELRFEPVGTGTIHRLERVS